MYDLKIACRGIPARYKLQFLTEPSQVLRTWRADPYFCWVSDTGWCDSPCHRTAGCETRKGSATVDPLEAQIPETPRGAMTVVSPALASGWWSAPGSTDWNLLFKAL